MRAVKSVFVVVLLLLLVFLAWVEVNAHDRPFTKPDGTINKEILNSILDKTKEEIFILGNDSAYLPTAEELSAITDIVSQKGKVFDGGFMVQAGDLENDNLAAYFFLMGDGSIVWALEERSQISSDGGMLYRRWKFFLERALVTISACQPSGTCEDMLYEEEVRTDLPISISKSRQALEKVVISGGITTTGGAGGSATTTNTGTCVETIDCN